MNELKDKYFFIVDLFLPEDDNFRLKEFSLAPVPSLRFFEYYIYPVVYRGFFESILYLLLKRESFLYEDKPALREDLRHKLGKGLRNLYSVNFRELNFEISGYTDEFKLEDEHLLLDYDWNGRSLLFLVPQEFIREFSGGFFRSFDKGKSCSLTRRLDHLSLHLYRENMTSFWDMGNFFRELPDKDIQDLFQRLLKGNMIEETMLTGFMANFHGTEIMDRIYRNLSQNIRCDVMKNLEHLIQDKRWLEECLYLVRLAVEELLWQEPVPLERLAYFHELKDRIRNERYRRIFRDKSFEQWLQEAKTRDMIELLKPRVNTRTILISLKGLDKEYLDFFLENASVKAVETMQEDYHFNLQNCTEQEVFESRIKVVEAVRGIRYEKKAGDISRFRDVLTRLSRSHLNLLVGTAGIVRFSQAILHEDKEFKKYVFYSVSGTVQDLLMDIQSGRIRFKQSFGEQTVNRAKKEILKICYSLEDDNKEV
ncbi:MAG: FliG C-terminal domain-containing protein [bacterium]|nr:FliG C-terminal domain-containing protein [bacterium]